MKTPSADNAWMILFLDDLRQVAESRGLSAFADELAGVMERNRAALEDGGAAPDNGADELPSNVIAFAAPR